MFSGMMKFGVGALAVVAIGMASARADDKEKPTGQKPDKAAMEKMMEEFGKPVEEHAHFKELAGEWTAEVKSFCMDPEKPQVSTGSATFKLLMGGRYLQQRFKCTMGDKPYEGLGICAYDKAEKKYVSTWIDNMGTGIMRSEGTCDKDTGTLTEVGESSSPVGKMKMKMVTKPVDKDNFVFTMYVTMPDGKETKGMEITYKRKK